MLIRRGLNNNVLQSLNWIYFSYYECGFFHSNFDFYDMAPNRWQLIIWKHDCPVYWRMCASLSLDEIIKHLFRRRDSCAFYSISQEICTRFLLCCALLGLYIDWFSHIHQAYFAGTLTIAPVPAKQPWWIWINTSREIIMNDYITTTKQSTTKPCASLLGNTVRQKVEKVWLRPVVLVVIGDVDRHLRPVCWSFFNPLRAKFSRGNINIY